MDKKFNLYWGDSGLMSPGSPHLEAYVINELFANILSESDAASLGLLEVGQKHVDLDGDTWERIA